MRLHSIHQKARLSAASAIDQLRHILAKSAEGTVTHQLDLGELEDRILLSASPAAVMVDSAPVADVVEVTAPLAPGSDSLIQIEPASSELLRIDSSEEFELETISVSEFLALEPADVNSFDTSLDSDAAGQIRNSTVEQTVTEVVFIDEAAEDFQQLLADLQAQRDAGRAVDFFILDSQADGIDQIAETLQDYSDLDAVHIVSHGSSGAVKLGATWLRIGSLDGYAGTIAGWGSAFNADGDILFYGCDLASNSRGEMLVDSIAALTGADVAASTDDTGSALRGGDWDLEFHSGSLETDVVFTEQLQTDWQGLLATSETHYFLTGPGVPQAELTQPIPTGTAVPDYDSGRDAGAGTLVDKGGSGFAESDPVKHQEWKLASGGFTIDGPASLTVYSAIKDFNTTKGATVHAYLLDVANNGSDPQLIASDTITRGTWNSTGDFVEDTFDFGNVTRTFSGNRRMQVKIVVDGSSEDDMIFAYDSVFYRSHLKVGITTSNGDPVITPGGSPLNYTENDAATEVDSGLSLSDDDANLEWATVQITGGFLSSEDILVFSDTLPAGITMENDAATGQIVFYGSSSVSNYESVLKLVRYQNTSEQPDTGARTVTFEVYDGQNLSTVTQDINITSVNDQPAVAANAADTAFEDQSIVYTHAQMLSLIGASDVDNSNAELTVNITGVTNATFNKTGSGTGTTYTFNSTQPQHSNGFTVTFNYEVLDLEPLSASGGPATITVLAVNDEPSFSTLGNQTVDEDTGFHSVGGFASAMPGGGADESGQTFSYMVSVDVPSLFSVLPAIDPSGTLTYTLAPDAIGTTTVTVSVTDNGGTANGGDDTSADQTFDIIVNNANNDDAFLLTNNPLNLNEGSTGSIGAALLEVADPDLPPTSSLTFTVTVSPTLGQLELTTAAGMGIGSFTQDDINTGKLVYVHGGAEAPLTDSFTFTATDGIGSPTGPQVFNINISNVNDAPVNSTPGAQATPQDTPLTFNTANGNLVSISDDDAGAAVVEVTLTVTNGTATLNMPTAVGTPAGPEALIPTTTGQTQSEPAIARAANGNYVVVWGGKVSGDDPGIGYQVFDANHNPIGGQGRANATKTDVQDEPSVAMDDVGNFVIVWTSAAQDSGLTRGVYGQRFNATGAKVGGEFLVNTTVANNQESAAVAMDSDGDFVVVWQADADQDGDKEGIFAQRFNSLGVKQGGEFQINNVFTNKQTVPEVAMDAAGNFVVTWQDKFNDGDNDGVYARRFDAAGNPLGNQFQVNTSWDKAQENPDIGMDSSGNFVIVWESKHKDGTDQSVYGQMYDSAGNTVGSEFQVNTFETSNQRDPSVSMDADGDFVVVWESVNQDNPGDFLTGIYAQQFDKTGAPVGSETLINNTVTGTQKDAAVAMDANGSFVVVWQGDSLDTGDIFARRYDIPSPPLTFTTGGGAADSLMTFTGNITDINNALDGITFTPDLGFTGLATLDITTDDLGNTGPGGAQQDMNTVNINVTGGGNTPPTISSNGGGTAAVVNVAENTTAVTTVTATDVDLPAQTLTYSISGGADQALFNIDSGSGVLTFTSAPDFESPADSDTDNVYEVTVLVSDGSGGTDTQSISVTVTDVGTLVVDTVSDVSDGDTSSISALIGDMGADGFISLREAITAANNTANADGTDRILFNIAGGGTHTINLTSALPTVTQAVIIDGWSEPDYGSTPVIELNGSGAGALSSGLTITGGGSTVRGLVINRFAQHGIELITGGGNVIEGTYLGTNELGTADEGNGLHGVRISDSANNVIGGATLASRNVISGNDNSGISMTGSGATGNVVQGNYIGLDVTGTALLGNTSFGVIVAAGATGSIVGTDGDGNSDSTEGNVIAGGGQAVVSIQDADNAVIAGNYLGTNAAGAGALGGNNVWITGSSTNTRIGTNADGTSDSAERNVISGLSGHGIIISGTASGTDIAGNYIGVGADGSTVISNGSNGITIESGNNNTIGGSSVGESNVISGNTGFGIEIDNGSSGNTIQGNLIGADAGGTLDRGNGGGGIYIKDGSNNTIGGTAAGEGNTIAYSGLNDGVQVQSGTGNSIRGNAIFANTGLGIELGTGGNVTNNDAGDGDGGPNLQQNFPVLSAAIVSGSNLTILGSLNSTSGTTFQIDFYASSSADGSGHGEAERYLGSASVLTNGSGNATINEMLSGVSVSIGEFVTATATDPSGNTSEFALNVSASSPNSAPTIISNGGGPTAAVNVFENTTDVTTVTATDADLPVQTLTYSISGGADQAVFNINSGSGVLTFASAPDFDSPTDANTDNVYEVTVQVNDDQGGLDTQAISVTVSATPSLTPTGEFLVNDTVTDQQVTSGQSRGSQQAVSLAADSSYVVAWTSLNQDGSGQGVYAQRFDTNGSALTAEFRVNQTTASDQQWARVASAADGSFVVTWTSNQGASQDVYYRRFAANGTALTAELVASTTTSGSQTNSVIDMDVNGDFVIAWQGNGTGDSTGIFAQRFNQSGTKVGSEFRVNTATFGTQSDPSVSVNGSRDFVIVWEDVGVIKAQRYNSGGVSQGSEITVDSNLLGISDRPAVGMADDGSFVVVWSDQPVLSSLDISGQRYNASGNTVGGEFTINTTTSSNQSAPSIAMSRNGDFIVTWEGNGTGDSSGVFARRYLANGTAQGAEFLVNQTTTGTQQFASLAMIDLDNYVVVWSGNGNQTGEVDSSGVFARQFGNAAGNTSPNANAGGPYVINEGDSVNLTGSASSDPDSDPLTYAWDLDNDGNYGEAGEPTTATPTVSWATLQSFGIADDGIHTIGLQVDDGNGGVDSATTVLTVNNVPPTITSSSSANVSENTTAVLTVAATDPVDTVTYSLSGGVDQGLFTINPTTGALSFATPPDFESPADNDTNNVYQVEVTAVDGDGGTDVQSISVSVTDVNDETPVITPGQTFNISESAANGTSLGTVTATDADAGTTFSNWIITGGNAAGVFGINSSTGELNVVNRSNLDFETTPSYVLSVTVSDGVNTSATQTVAISVLDQNDESPVITPGQAFNVNESATNGTALGTVVATDADAGTTFSNWTITGGNTGGVFAINSSTGELTVADKTNLDFETTANYVLSLTVSDGLNTSTVETVSISVVDVNEAPGVSLNQTSSALSENADTSSAIVMAAISVTDDSLGTNSLSLSGSDAADFEIVGGSLRLRAGTPLDFETKPAFNVTVEINDPLVGSNPDDSQSFALTINGVNDAPTTSGLPDAIVNEDSPNVPIDLTTAFSDAETASSLLTYAVLNNSNPALFNAASISGGTLTLDFAADAHGSSVITVQASDPQGATVSTAFTATVQPLPDAPVSSSDSYDVTENSLVVSASNGVLANDSDADGDTLTALLISGPTNGSLTMRSDGSFTYTPTGDFTGVDSFAYQAFDGTATGATRTVVLNVVRAVAPPPPPTSSDSSESTLEESAVESESSETQINTESEEAPAVTESVATVAAQESETANANTETTATNESSADDDDAEQILATTGETSETSNFFDSDSARLELRDAESIRSETDISRIVGGAAADTEVSFQNSLRFNGEDLSFLVGTEFIQELEQVEEEFEFDGTVPEWATGTAVATSASISVGYIMWMLRGGYVLASVMSTLPVWQNIDPLPVFAALDAADADDDESLQSMIDDASDKSDVSENPASDEAASDTTRKESSV